MALLPALPAPGTILKQPKLNSHSSFCPAFSSELPSLWDCHWSCGYWRAPLTVSAAWSSLCGEPSLGLEDWPGGVNECSRYLHPQERDSIISNEFEGGGVSGGRGELKSFNWAPVPLPPGICAHADPSHCGHSGLICATRGHHGRDAV